MKLNGLVLHICFMAIIRKCICSTATWIDSNRGDERTWFVPAFFAVAHKMLPSESRRTTAPRGFFVRRFRRFAWTHIRWRRLTSREKRRGFHEKI